MHTQNLEHKRRLHFYDSTQLETERRLDCVTMDEMSA